MRMTNVEKWPERSRTDFWARFATNRLNDEREAEAFSVELTLFD